MELSSDAAFNRIFNLRKDNQASLERLRENVPEERKVLAAINIQQNNREIKELSKRLLTLVEGGGTPYVVGED